MAQVAEQAAVAGQAAAVQVAADHLLAMELTFKLDGRDAFARCGWEGEEDHTSEVEDEEDNTSGSRVSGTSSGGGGGSGGGAGAGQSNYNGKQL